MSALDAAAAPPAAATPPAPGGLPWWRSRIIVGAAVSILAKLLVAFEVTGEIGPEEEARITDALLLLIGLAGDLAAIGARIVQRRAPPIIAR